MPAAPYVSAVAICSRSGILDPGSCFLVAGCWFLKPKPNQKTNNQANQGKQRKHSEGNKKLNYISHLLKCLRSLLRRHIAHTHHGTLWCGHFGRGRLVGILVFNIFKSPVCERELKCQPALIACCSGPLVKCTSECVCGRHSCLNYRLSTRAIWT